MPSARDYQILAERDYKVCCKLEEDFPDEYALSGVLYHIGQAIEKQLKALALLYGETPDFTHNITKLTDRCHRLGIELPEELDDIADSLTLWESKSRYDPFILFTNKKYEKAKDVFADLKELLQNSLDSISDEVEEEDASSKQTM